MKKFACFTLTIALLMGVYGAFLPRLAAAEDIKPVLTVSFAGYEEDELPEDLPEEVWDPGAEEAEP